MNFNQFSEKNSRSEGGSDLAKKLKYGFSVLGVAIIGWNSFVALDETERGIDYRFGKMTSKTTEDLRGPGLSFKMPFFTSVKKVRVDQQHMDIEKMRTYTKDNQVITMDNTVFYKLPVENLIKIYKNNPDWEAKLKNGTIDAVKSALGQTEAQNVAFNRDKIMNEVTKETADQIKTLLGIEVSTVLMPNYDFNDDYEAAVSSASKEKARLVQKQTQFEQANIDAKTKLVQAQATADAQKISADGQAYSTIKTKEAEAQAFEKVQKVIGFQNMGTYLVTQRWNGVGPTAVGTTNINDVSKLVPVIK